MKLTGWEQEGGAFLFSDWLLPLPHCEVLRQRVTARELTPGRRLHGGIALTFTDSGDVLWKRLRSCCCCGARNTLFRCEQWCCERRRRERLLGLSERRKFRLLGGCLRVFRGKIRLLLEHCSLRWVELIYCRTVCLVCLCWGASAARLKCAQVVQRAHLICSQLCCGRAACSSVASD